MWDYHSGIFGCQLLKCTTVEVSVTPPCHSDQGPFPSLPSKHPLAMCHLSGKATAHASIANDLVIATIIIHVVRAKLA